MNYSENNRRNLLLFLLILAIFIGATMEYGHGSPFIGVLLFVIALILISQIKFEKTQAIKSSKFLIALGVLIIILDIGYNLLMDSELGTLDTMTFLLGASLIASSVKNEQVRKIATFSIYMSLSFIILFVIFFTILHSHTNLINYTDHYLVAIPSTYVCNAIGLPIEMIKMRTVLIHGSQDMYIEIGGPCSGLYSMFLLISIIIGYAKTEKIQKRKMIGLLIIAALVAYIANLFRVSTLYYVAYLYGFDMMMTMHTHLGWMIFAVVAMVLMWALDRVRYKSNSGVFGKEES